MGFRGEPNVTAQLVSSFNETETSTIAIMEVLEKDVSKYGIADVEEVKPGFFKVNSLIEKPKPHQTKSRWALPGRYVFDSEIMNLLKNATPSLNGEIQLTDSMKVLCESRGLNAMTFKANRYDAGDKLGYLQANIELGLRNPELQSGLRDYILAISKKLKNGFLE
jgi:UTP--glucose-1-phosphate uridylyltransferase